MNVRGLVLCQGDTGKLYRASCTRKPNQTKGKVKAEKNLCLKTKGRAESKLRIRVKGRIRVKAQKHASQSECKAKDRKSVV